MEISSFMGGVFIFYTILYYVDSYLKVKHPYKYQQFLHRTNITVNFLNIRWSTTAFNGFLTRLGNSYPRFFDFWFKLGSVLTVLLILPSIFLLVSTLYSAASNFTGGKTVETALQPVLPGVNLPKSEWLYYVITLAICTAFHEAGHALAAVREQVSLLGVGFLLFLILPAAYVEIPTTSVISLPNQKQLRVYCAGIWHNVALSVAAYVALLTLPFLSLPLYQTGSGIVVHEVQQDQGSHWFIRGDHIHAVDDCQVLNTGDWQNCLLKALREPQKGFCVEKQMIPETKKRDRDCCAEDVSRSHLCFEVKGANYCIRARTVTESSTRRCALDQSCDSEDHLCLLPDLRASNSTRLLLVSRKKQDDVLFVGEPGELYSTVYVDDYVPRTSIFGSSFIRFVDHLLRYLVSFSAGLAILNIVPCMAMDGQHIITALFDLLWSSTLSQPSLRRAIQCSLWFGTSLVITNVIIGMITLM